MNDPTQPRASDDENLLDLWRRTSADQDGRADRWGLAALQGALWLNAAALAGAMVAAQVPLLRGLAQTPGWASLAGLIAAIVALISGLAAHRQAASRYRANALAYQQSQQPLQLFDQDERKLKLLTGLSFTAGIVSYALFLQTVVQLSQLLLGD